ncbi:MAG TPA: B12-binding domain-containing radical SAM protein, partial [Proteobacteria bacterium]|nr:B12-binding domain-containing radical SAM protein [Pseudomonadota bacterium]
SSQAPHFATLAEAIKAHLPDVPLLCGGFHANLAYEDILKNTKIDAVVLGEGELALVEYLEALKGGGGFEELQNFCFMRDGELVANPVRPFIKDLGSLPYCDKEVLDYQVAINHYFKTAILLASRGCPWACKFCSNNVFRHRGKGEYARLRPVEHVMGEIEDVESRFKFNYFFFRDDTFTWNKEWTLKFCEEYPKHTKKRFDILTRADCVDEDIAKALAEAGCQCSWIGVDAGNDYIRMEVLDKRVTKEQYIEAADLLHKYGISVMTTNMIGLPYETPERAWETIELNRRIYRDYVSFSPANGSGPKIFTFAPFPGTPLYDLCKREGWMTEWPKKFMVYYDTYIDMPQFPRKKVLRMKKSFRYHVYRPNHPVKAFIYLVWDWVIGPLLLFNMRTRPLMHLLTNALSPVMSGLKAVKLPGASRREAAHIS